MAVEAGEVLECEAMFETLDSFCCQLVDDGALIHPIVIDPLTFLAFLQSGLVRR